MVSFSKQVENLTQFPNFANFSSCWTILAMPADILPPDLINLVHTQKKTFNTTSVKLIHSIQDGSPKHFD